VNAITALVVFVGIPVLVAVIIAALVYGSSWTRGNGVSGEIDAGPFLTVSDASQPDPSRLPQDITGAPAVAGGISTMGAPVADGVLTDAQRVEVHGIVQKARAISGFRFCAYVGPLAEGRATAETELAGLKDGGSAILVAVDPATGAIEIVSGASLGTHLAPRDYELAALSMVSCLNGGSIVEALREGAIQLAQHARPQRTLHLDLPA
jgi:hypothetical protein